MHKRHIGWAHDARERVITSEFLKKTWKLRGKSLFDFFWGQVYTLMWVKQ